MNQRLQSALIIVAVFVLDRITKLWVIARVSSADVFPVIPGFFNIVHAENPGAAFSMLADAPAKWRGVVLVGFSIAVMAVVAAIMWRPIESRLMRIALPLVFGGALGNLIDRAFRGTVTDFLQFFFGSYEYPSFNIADSAITVGAVLLVIDLIRAEKKRKQPLH
jgi:signal peptidase II